MATPASSQHTQSVAAATVHAGEDTADSAGSKPPPAESRNAGQEEQPALAQSDVPLLLPAPTDTDRPTDADILAWQNEIRAAEAQKSEYVGPIETLDSLKKEYEAGSEVFVRKIEKLEQVYGQFRRTRGDGNCFFRGFTFGLLENLLLTNDMAECNRLLQCVQGWKAKLVDVGFQELVFEDAMELLLQQLQRIQDGAHSPALLEVDMRDDMVSNMIVMLIRMLASGEVRRREDFFLPFIMGMYDDPPATLELFCQRHVECMGEESDHLHIVAITDALQVPVRIIYLDRSGMLEGGGPLSSDLDYNHHDFVPEACTPGTVPRVHLLYRPGHYDILYPK